MKRFAAAGLILGLLLAGCGGQSGDTFGFVLAAEPRQLDPQVAADEASLTVISAVFEGLARLDENGAVVPGAADWTVSEDGCTYTFTLRESCWSTVWARGEDTGFEDPVMVTAADFEFGIRRVADATTGSPYRSLLAGIENAGRVLANQAPVTALGVRAVDARTLVIRLSAPDPEFPRKLTTPAFMPCNRDFFGYTGGRYGLESRYVLTNGAFTISNCQHEASITLKKNLHYHDAADIRPATVKYRISTDPAEDFALLEEGYIDGAAVPPDCVERARAAGLRLVTFQDTVRFLWMNTGVSPLSNGDIRRALRDAMSWDVLWDSLGAGHTPATGFVAPAAAADGGQYRSAAELPPFRTDEAAARRSLEQGLAALELDTLPVLTLLAAEDDETANLARYILQSFQKHLSVRCTLELVPADTLAARVQAGNYQLAIYDTTARGLSAKENLAAFTTAGIGNHARFSAAAYDTLYAAVGDDRASVAQLETALYNACPALPLSFGTRFYGVLPEDDGITVYPFDGGAYHTLFSFRHAEKIK